MRSATPLPADSPRTRATPVHRRRNVAGPATPPPRAVDAAPTMVALSGGVDSAVALMRLVEAGVPVQAMFMKNWEEDDQGGYCAAAEDFADAQRVCDRLGIPLHAVNCSDAYWNDVFVRFIRGLEGGLTRTPTCCATGR